jgi:methionine sulfoxide reductase heme-binding subunit
MSSQREPLGQLPWLISRSAGILALVLATVAVTLGLTMSARLLRRPGVARTLVRLHEHVALVAMAAIAVHGLALLGDRWLHPGVGGLTVPFAMSYRPLFTGLGIIGGYLAALLGLSFYVRKRIGVRLWRRLHRATVLVWVLGVVHTLGAGSDASTVWLRALVLVPAVPITYLIMRRWLEVGRRDASAPRDTAATRRPNVAGAPTPRPRSSAPRPSSFRATLLAKETSS